MLLEEVDLDLQSEQFPLVEDLEVEVSVVEDLKHLQLEEEVMEEADLEQDLGVEDHQVSLLLAEVDLEDHHMVHHVLLLLLRP